MTSTETERASAIATCGLVKPMSGILKCSDRLFQEEEFRGLIDDPCCGCGRIPETAKKAGFMITASDIVDRGYRRECDDFLKSNWHRDNIVSNPPFKPFRQFAEHTLEVTKRKVALIWQVPRLNAAGKWLRNTPLKRVWFMTPRPSMPPGHVVLELEVGGKRPSGGTADYAWLIFEHGYVGHPEMRWLHRGGRTG